MRTVAVDYETVGLRPQEGAYVFSCIMADVETGEWVLWDRDVVGYEWFVAQLRSVWEDPTVAKVAHNLKFELHHTRAMGIVPAGPLHDTMILHQLLHNLAPKHSLDYCARELMGIVPEWDEVDREVTRAAHIYGTYDKVPRALMHSYQRADGERTALLYSTLYPLVQQDARLLADYRNEIALVQTTVRLENNGIMVDRANAAALIRWMEEELEHVEAETTALFGEPVNLSSPAQLIHVLFDVLHLPVPGWTESGKPSTEKDALEKLRATHPHPVLDLVLRKRSYTKGLAMVRAYLANATADGILYPSINTNRAQTGRQSSSDPINFQNIQKEFALKTRFAVPARRCFRARPGHVWFCEDYQGIEMRLGVQGTGSPRLVQLLTENFDFHAACAASFYGKRFTEEQDPAIKKMLRSAAKNARFAMFYGAGMEKVADTLVLSVEETQEGYLRDRHEYPEFYAFMERCTRFARTHGYIETFFGRRLAVYHDKPYIATDYCIQGSAAGVLKRAQVALDRYFTEELHGEVKMLLPVHDELIIEYPRALFPYREEVLHKVRELMIRIECVTVPLEVEVKMTTTTWDKAKEVQR